MILEGSGDLAAVKKRGRWRTDASVRRYEKSGLVQKVWLNMSEVDQRFCRRAAAKLGGALERRASGGMRTQSGPSRRVSSLTSSAEQRA